ENLATETLQQQFAIVKNETTTSHVVEFGDLNRYASSDASGLAKYKEWGSLCYLLQEDAVPSEDVKLHILEKKIESAVGIEKKKYEADLQSLLQVMVNSMVGIESMFIAVPVLFYIIEKII
ncbi:unnamed protein product, partial [Candidula unifasciata]